MPPFGKCCCFWSDDLLSNGFICPDKTKNVSVHQLFISHMHTQSREEEFWVKSNWYVRTENKINSSDPIGWSDKLSLSWNCLVIYTVVRACANKVFHTQGYLTMPTHPHSQAQTPKINVAHQYILALLLELTKHEQAANRKFPLDHVSTYATTQLICPSSCWCLWELSCIECTCDVI